MFLLYSVIRQRGIEDFEVSCAIVLKAELKRIQLTYWIFFFLRKKKEKQVDETFRHSYLGLLCRHVLLEFSLHPSNKLHSSLNLQPNRSQLKNAHQSTFNNTDLYTLSREPSTRRTSNTNFYLRKRTKEAPKGVA